MRPRFSRLVMMRHAKAEVAAPGQADHARPLRPKGWRAAEAVARRLDQLGWLPDEVMSSDALRTVETLAGLDLAWRTDAPRAPSTFHRRLYMAGWMDFCAVVASARSPTVLVVGHNPGWEQVVELLCGQHVPMNPGCAVLLTREHAAWDVALEPDTWGLVDVLRPQDLG